MDLVDLLKIVRRRYLLGVVVGLSIVLAVTIFAFVVKPTFSATSTVEVLPSPVISADPKAPSTTAADEAKIETELQFINSNAVLSAVVRHTNLTRDPEFSDDEPPSETKTMDALNKQVQVARRGTSYLIDISVRSGSPAKAAMLANEIANNYMTESEIARQAASARQITELNKQLRSLAVEVKDAESAAASFRGATGIVSGESGTVNDQQIAGITGALASADSASADARSRANAAENLIRGGDLTSVGQVAASPAIVDLRRQRGELLREKAKIANTYGPRHPESVRVDSQLADIDAEIQSEARRVVEGLKSDAAAAEARSSRLRGDLEGLRQRQARDASASVSGDALSRAASAKRQIYDQLALTAQQAMQNQGLEPGRSRIVEGALAPSEPVFPNKKLLLALGVFIGAAAGLTAIFVAEALDQGLRSLSEIDERLKIAALVALPHLSKRDLERAGADGEISTYVAKRPVSPYAESLRTLRTSLQWGAGENSRVIGVTSAIPNEGKTAVAASMARVMAMGGRRTLLIDTDLRMAKHMSRLIDKPEAGLVEVLSGRASLQSALYSDMDNLHILGPLKPEFMAADVLGGPEMRALLETVRGQYDHIVVDTPPLLSVADAVVLAKLVDTSVLVIRWRKTPIGAVKRALEQIHEVDGKLAGAVLNDVGKAGLTSGADAGYYRDADMKYYQA
jgi:capsular exopolysaccharide synthesis family protein